jgi:hypothetical protein
VTTSFQAAFEKLLPIRERLALPGVSARVRITGGDATLDRIGALDWKAKKYMLEEVTDVLASMREHLQVEAEEEIIALNELLCFLLLAVARKAEWKGELVLYVTDNQNVRSWLLKRRPRPKTARQLILLLQRLEVEYDFSCYPVYIRTYRNHLADWLSRENPELVHHQLGAEGWVRETLAPDWAEILEILRTGALRLPGESGALAKVARRLTQVDGLPDPAPRISISSGWCVFLQGPASLSSVAIALAKHGHTPRQEGSRWWVTLTQDPTGKEWGRALQCLAEQEPLDLVLVDMPRQVEAQVVEKDLCSLGLRCHFEPYLTSALGGLSARKRQLAIGYKGRLPLVLEGLRVNPPLLWKCYPLTHQVAKALL